jgi:hypothetical protein
MQQSCPFCQRQLCDLCSTCWPYAFDTYGFHMCSFLPLVSEESQSLIWFKCCQKSELRKLPQFGYSGVQLIPNSFCRRRRQNMMKTRRLREHQLLRKCRLCTVLLPWPQESFKHCPFVLKAGRSSSRVAMDSLETDLQVVSVGLFTLLCQIKYTAKVPPG